MYHYVDLPFREKKAGKYHFNCVMLGKGRHKVIKQILSGLGYDADPLYADSPQPEVKKTDELITENFTPEIHNIDPLYYQIESPKYSFTLVETPEGLENTCQSITQSHVAMLCIPADKVESELEVGGSARRDIMLLGALRVSQLIIVITSMDQVWHNHTTYKELVAKCEQVLDVSGIVKRVITCTDNLGDNVIKDPKTLTWEPKTMVELLDWYDVIPHNRPMYQARMSIAHKEGFGMLDSGYLNSGQQVLVNDKKTHIKIKRINGQSGIRTAYGGESIEFDLDGKDIHVGDVISNCDRPVKYDKEFVAKFILLAPVDIKNKEKITLHINNISAKAWIDGILMIENPTDGKLIQDKYSPVAGECFIGRIKTDDKIPFEHVKEFFTFGRFVLARGEEIVAVGSIVPNASQEWPHDNQRTAEAA